MPRQCQTGSGSRAACRSPRGRTAAHGTERGTRLGALAPAVLPVGMLLLALLAGACGSSAPAVPHMPEYKEGRRYLQEQARREAYYEQLRRYRDDLSRLAYAESLECNQREWEAIGIHAPSEWVPPPEKPHAPRR